MIQTRQAGESDVAVLYDMMLKLAQHHRLEAYLKADREVILRDLIQKNRFEAILAEYDRQPAGFVSYTINYSIWSGKDYLHIDDVFTFEAFRGKGVGSALMESIRNTCLEKGIDTVKWQVEKENTGAIRFYERLGAKLKVKGIFSWNV